MTEASAEFDFHAVLDTLREDLLDDMDLVPVLEELRNSGVFRPRILRDLQEKYNTTTEKIEALLQLVRDGGYTKYDQLKKCLVTSGQESLVDIMEAAERNEEHKPAKRKKPMTQEEKLQEALIDYYLEYESTMPVAPLVQQHDVELTSFYVRPPMMAYRKPNAFGQVKQSKEQEKSKISSYRELLFSDNGPYKRIYLTADAGMGKTSFSKMLARTWCQAHKLDKDVADKFSKDDLDTMRNFDFLFLIKLREYQGTDMCCLDDMIVTMLSKLPRASCYTKRFVEQILCNRQCMFIVDGLDEWRHPQHTTSQALPVEVIPHTTRLPGCCSVLTTARPWKLSDARLSKADIDRQLEISQLDETTARELESRAVEILIENQRQNGQAAANSKTKTVTDFENSVPEKILGHILYIPFVLLQMICLWFGNSPIGKSLCEVYTNIIELTLTRWLVKTDSGHTDCKCEPSREHENIKLKCMENNRHCQRHMPLLLKIEELAFSTLFNVIREESLLFDKEQVLKYLSKDELEQCLDMGLLSQVKDTTSLTKVRMQLYFPHKTLHEFFCALFIATNWNNADTGTKSIKPAISNKCTSISDILEMSEVFVFVCGLNPEVYSDISRHLASIVSIGKIVIDYRDSVENYLYSNLLEGYQRMQIFCFLESTRNQHPECKIVIEHMSYGRYMWFGDMEEDEYQALERILLDSACSMKSLTLVDLRSAGGIVRIPEHDEFPCLERLIVQECELTWFESVLTCAAHTLKYLQLAHEYFTDDMCSPISRLSSLQGLALDGVKVSSVSLNAVSECISGFMLLQQLRLHFRYWPSDTDEKGEQLEASYNYLLISIEAKKMLTYLSMSDHTVGHKKYVLDLSKHDKLQELDMDLPLTELHINTEHLVNCDVHKMDGFSAPAVSSLLAEFHGAPVLKTLTLRDIGNTPPRIEITALAQLTEFIMNNCNLSGSTVTLTPPGLTEFVLSGCVLSGSTVTLTLPRLTEFTLEYCDLSGSTVTLTLPLLKVFILEGCDLSGSTVTLTLPRLTEFTPVGCDLRDSTLFPEMTSLEIITLASTTMNIPRYRELFLSVSKLPQPITVELEEINLTVEEWKELLFDILGKLPKSIHVEMQKCRGPSEEEWRNIFHDMKASPAFCVTSTDYKVGDRWDSGADITFDTVVV